MKRKDTNGRKKMESCLRVRNRERGRKKVKNKKGKKNIKVNIEKYKKQRKK